MPRNRPRPCGEDTDKALTSNVYGSHPIQAPLDQLRPAKLPSYVARISRGIRDDGTRTITPDCVTEQEIDYWFDKLIAERQELRSRAKRRIRNG